MRSIFYILNVFAIVLALQIVELNTNILRAQDLSAVHDNVSMNTNETLNIPVLDNDAGGGIVVTQFVQPKHGLVLLDELTNQFSYTPNPGYYGNDIFVYQIEDSLGQTARASVFIVVHHNGTAPLTVKAAIECTNYLENIFYFKIKGGVLPYAISGDWNGTLSSESVISITLYQYTSYNINVTDAAGTIVNINNLEDYLPCLKNGIIDIE